jgi:putative transposase
MKYSDAFPISRICQVLGVCRSAYYANLNSQESKRDIENKELLDKIHAIHTNSRGVYGSPKIQKVLNNQGYCYGHNRIARIMKENNIKSKVIKKFRKKSKVIKASEAFPNVLNRDFNRKVLDEVWATDITYIPTKKGWTYLCVFMDLCSRKIVGWSVAQNMKTDLVLKAFDNARKARKPGNDLIIHSDQGSQFGSHDFKEYIAKYNFMQSMSRRGNCWDNACVESFFRLIKVEELNDYIFEDLEDVKYKVFSYIEYFYNRQRVHSQLGYISPSDYEKKLGA